MKIAVLDKGFIELVDVMGDDLMVVNTARVSFAKTSRDFDERDEKLLNYLADNGHVSPFYHPHLQFRVKAPISVQRQWATHKIGTAMNSESTRYIEVVDEFYIPDKFRAQSKDNKQGSSGMVESQGNARIAYLHAMRVAFENYQTLIGLGVAKEQAREILPLATYTSWIWTASLAAVIHFIHLRDDSHAQEEVRLYARAMRTLTEQYFPNALKAALK